MGPQPHPPRQQQAIGNVLHLLGIVHCNNSPPSRPLLQDDAIWKALSERKWGPWVCRLAHVGPGQWKAYAMHRINSESLPPSPLNLIQEQYPDPWQHLVSSGCLKSGMKSGGYVITFEGPLCGAIAKPSLLQGNIHWPSVLSYPAAGPP